MPDLISIIASLWHFLRETFINLGTAALWLFLLWAVIVLAQIIRAYLWRGL
jgi:hypothetical protein